MLRSIIGKSASRSLNFVAKRSYAEAAAASSGLKLQFALPHETLYSGSEVTQVNLPAKSGRIGVLANHVPTVEQLLPGVVEVMEGSNSKKFFISGGFATVQPDSQLCVTAIEAFPLESFSQENIKNLLAEAKKNVSSSDAREAAEAAIQVEVLENLESVLK
ncbi:XXYS1_4_G0045530.mRNA.1.CDS.1 [Saccharomyces cerevisiae]|nr:XXYS1_4_G0045530.mRNA.1.CDS.1 [Saccharomyces cerevisiae]CAD6609750.1 EM14S01-3B_G0043280.mRNA.1.CDS.1 [Saccharomyces cerevisiae]CAI4331934.1 AMH_1a_G0008940.mRNA.1.CDS.1 [Saccharomyces cerevisiae]CAI4336104.1 CEI_1a_G0008580.mRNA.1.CDS.1 [Saccharomyces cerevisiae]CAI6549046.1 AMH_1a_G0008940.mRNA.1.CDS.1 [Saccharomyces cerevisiae]